MKDDKTLSVSRISKIASLFVFAHIFLIHTLTKHQLTEILKIRMSNYYPMHKDFTVYLLYSNLNIVPSIKLFMVSIQVVISNQNKNI